jgi:molecular chaperone Hsp33
MQSAFVKVSRKLPEKIQPVSELHTFLFEGLPVRGVIVRLTNAWTEILQRRADSSTGAYPEPVQNLLGEMVAAGALMQANIKFNGALILQIFGDGPLKLSVVEVKSDLSMRATATVRGEIAADADLPALVNTQGLGRCAITLDPHNPMPGQQPYQGVVPLSDADEQPLNRLSDVLQNYMRLSEQLETTLVLAANDQVAAGLLIQRLPLEGKGNLAGQGAHSAEELNEHYNRIAVLASSLKREELLTLDVETILHRLFWEEQLQRFVPLTGESAPRFACTCSRERVSRMIQKLGEPEARDIIAEMGAISVDCEFCGAQYRFDAIDAAQIFKPLEEQPPSSEAVQ